MSKFVLVGDRVKKPAYEARMSPGNFEVNLQRLCAQKKSISLVSRELGINRQQFSRYLNGTNRPGSYLLKKICDYFGIASDDIDLPPEQFAELVDGLPGEATVLRLPTELSNELLAVAARSLPHLDRHVGFHFRYYYAYAFPGYVFKTLTAVRKLGTYYCTKQIVRVPGANAPTHTPLIFKYNGLLLDFCDRLFLVERLQSKEGSLSQSVFAPLYRPGVRLMSGVANSVASSTGSDPAATRTVMEFIGTEIDLRAALKSCGLFHPEEGVVNPHVLAMIDNRNKRKNHIFLSHPG